MVFCSSSGWFTSLHLTRLCLILMNMVILCFFVRGATSAPSPLGYFTVAHYNKLSICQPQAPDYRAKPAPCGAILNQRLSSLWRDKQRLTVLSSLPAVSFFFLYEGSTLVLTPQGLRLAFYWGWIGCVWLTKQRCLLCCDGYKYIMRWQKMNY